MSKQATLQNRGESLLNWSVMMSGDATPWSRTIRWFSAPNGFKSPGRLLASAASPTARWQAKERVVPTTCPATCSTDPCTPGTPRSPRLSSQPPEPQALGLLKISAHRDGMARGQPRGLQRDVDAFEVRTSVELAPGTQPTNTCPGPIEKTGLVPISAPPATAGAATVSANAASRIRSRALVRPSLSAARLATRACA